MKRLVGVYWWVDRWRKSSAYSDMSAEEQGVYRNLIDEVTVRKNHVIPDDDETLAKVSGDPIAWPKVRAKVLRWMRKVKGGWTNVTARDVARVSTRRAQAQANYRARSGHYIAKTDDERRARNAARMRAYRALKREGASRADNVTHNSANNVRDYPYPYPYVNTTNNIPVISTSESPEATPASPGESASPIAVAPWNSKACEVVIAAYGGTAPGARITKALRPLVRKNGEAIVLDAFARYVAETEARYFSPERFATTFGHWTGDRQDVPSAHRRALQATIDGSLRGK